MLLRHVPAMVLPFIYSKHQHHTAPIAAEPTTPFQKQQWQKYSEQLFDQMPLERENMHFQHFRITGFEGH